MPTSRKTAGGRRGSESPARAARIGRGNAVDRRVLTDDPLLQTVIERLDGLDLVGKQLADRNAGPARDDVGDDVPVDNARHEWRSPRPAAGSVRCRKVPRGRFPPTFRLPRKGATLLPASARRELILHPSSAQRLLPAGLLPSAGAVPRRICLEGRRSRWKSAQISASILVRRSSAFSGLRLASRATSASASSRSCSLRRIAERLGIGLTCERDGRSRRIDQADRLVRQLPCRKIAGGKPHRGNQELHPECGPCDGSRRCQPRRAASGLRFPRPARGRVPSGNGRVRAASFSTKRLYSLQVVAAMVRSSPRARAGFRMLAASP